MKFLSLLALAAAALAAVTPVAPRDTADAPAVEAPKHDDKPDHDDGHKPVGWHPECKPGIYACTPDKKGWLVCNTGYKWVVSILLTPEQTNDTQHTHTPPTTWLNNHLVTGP